MKRTLQLAGAAALVAVAVLVFRSTGSREGAAEAPEFVSGAVSASPIVRNVRRVGVGLGSWTSWGAEQLSSNVLKNPGLEGTIDRAIVIATHPSPRRFSDDRASTAWPDRFWSGASCEARSGAAAGKRSRIVASAAGGGDGLPAFETADDLGLAEGDAVALTRVDDAAPATGWWVPLESARAVAWNGPPRPGSPGVRSASLAPKDGRAGEIVSYLDTIGQRGGRMLPVNGKWRLSFWAAAPDGASPLAVRFFRQGSRPFVDRTVTAGGWKQEVVEFSASDDGPPGPLELHFRAESGRVLIDDVELRNTADEGPFRGPVVETLRRLHPGYLRDWQGQLGDTLENRVAAPLARRASRFRPGGAEDAGYFYSIPEFLDLCRRVGADPWIVVPPAFGDDDLAAFGRMLAAKTAGAGFNEIVVEFGNENWNPIFRSGVIPHPAAHGDAAARAARTIRQAAVATPIRFVVNGQHADPALTDRFVERAAGADAVAVAPYFFRSLRRGAAERDSWQALFAGDGGKLRDIVAAAARRGLETAVYEVNVDTTEGDAPQSERDPIVAGPAAGAALAKTVLDAYAVGIRRQCLYALAGFDVYLSDVASYTRLFGLARDLGETGRLRPTGLAMALLNQVVDGDLYRVDGISAASGVSAYAFRGRSGWALAVVSSSPYTEDLSIRLPAGAATAVEVRRLDAEFPDATNEDGEQVRVVAEPAAIQGGALRLTVPPRGLLVALPAAEGGTR